MLKLFYWLLSWDLKEITFFFFYLIQEDKLMKKFCDSFHSDILGFEMSELSITDKTHKATTLFCGNKFLSFWFKNLAFLILLFFPV